MKVLFAAFLCVIAFTACKKDDTDSIPSNTLSASIDGSSKTFNTALTGSLISNGGAQGLQVMGFAGAAGSSDALYLGVSSDGQIVPGTYVDGQGAGIIFSSQSGAITNYTNAESATNPISITITSITSTKVTGTFKGDLFVDGNSASAKKVLTSGTFSATIQ
jgi:hypothetical protein